MGMTIDRRIPLALVTVSASLFAAGASAQTPTPTPAMRATLQARHGSAMTGNVSVTPHGANSMVTVTLSKPRSGASHALTLISGSDCADALRRTPRAVTLNPANGQVSHTLVAIPFDAFSSHTFAVDVRDATGAAGQLEACGRL